MATGKIALLMGSKSDLPKIEGAIDVLQELDIPLDVHVMSAHRTPERVAEFAESAAGNGYKAIIAAAGGAAHLAGVVAAHTLLPVIGIPVEGGALQGLDALLATVQMPGGIPVATVGIGRGGAKNAALLAIHILAIEDSEVRQRLKNYRSLQRDKVIQADNEIQSSIKR
ncbi:MAG: 5-(carboxyamino)imidazole ribonucleotide mutase [Candidatus Pacebacteria bacterium]|nr:5-(carboxyamino)imidazole ribonucleotide mutase [Candidatus Paceibacterota bacterium]